MNTNIWRKRFAAILGLALTGTMLATGATAANPESVVAQVTFSDPITITEVSALQYGILDQALNTETIIIAPDSTVTGTGTGLILGGTQDAAELTIGAVVAQPITIVVGTIVSGAGYTLGTFMCNYNTGSDTACDGAGYSETSATSATLFVGATLTGDNTAVPGAADGSFIVTITYQ